ncbi:MAG: transglycosylase SLT domain-containing protein [Gemmatimonadales bacterium]
MPPSSVRTAALVAGTLLGGRGLTAGQPPTEPPARFTDSIVATATRAVDDGRPWQATRLLAPLTDDPATAPSALVLAGAKAAAGWQGWAAVVRLLYQRDWLSREPTGVGSALLGRALVERAQPAAALPHTRSAVALADDDNRGGRLVTHARALDRAGQLDSAAVTYLAAARALPPLADWLILRAAGVTADSASRAALYPTVTSAVAKARIPWTEALARERIGDSVGAARLYTTVGARLAAVRLRLGGDSASRAAARGELFALLGPERPSEETAEAIALFDRAFPRRRPHEELRIARRAANLNLLDRAARGFAAASAALGDRDRFTWATVLSRLGRYEQALPLFDAVRTPDLRGDAAYQRARMLLRNGQATRALTDLRTIPGRFPADSEPAASALFLLADLQADRGADDSARALFLEAATRYPATPFGQRASFQAALIAFLDGDLVTATREFDRIASTPNHGEAIGAAYWAARVRETSGDSAAARQRYTAVIGRSRESYYAVRAADRLGVSLRTFAANDPAPDSVSPAIGRGRSLAELGMRTEMRFELDGVAASAGPTSGRIVTAAQWLASGNWHARALRLAQRAQANGTGFSRSVAELLYPLPFRDLLFAQARRSRASPYLVAGLIRQESLFDPEARSTADARGLMQVLPSVGEALAKPVGIEWDPALLYQPDLNIDLGIRHLDEALGALEWKERALAAYNGGVDRVKRWRTIRGVEHDPEIFVERIPFAETRDYVRRILANEAMYLALYGGPDGS